MMPLSGLMLGHGARRWRSVSTVVLRTQLVRTMYGSISGRECWAYSALISRYTAATNSSRHSVSRSSWRCAALCHSSRSFKDRILTPQAESMNECTFASSLAASITHIENAEEYVDGRVLASSLFVSVSDNDHIDSLQGRMGLDGTCVG